MIIWLASYPKSGNTWVRSFITSLLYNENNEANLKDLIHIQQYPLRSHFTNLVSDIDNLGELSSNWILSQKIINQDNKIKFFKTHHAFCKFNNSFFTNGEVSLGTVHIVRDPRNVISSILYHFSKKNYEEAREFLFDERRVIVKKFDPKDPNVNKNILTVLGSWKNHYLSWKEFKKNYLLIKYEDLLSNPQAEFHKLSEYLSKHLNVKFENDKINHAIKSNSFENLKKLEKENGFIEAINDKETGEKKRFFNLGPENDWKKLLNIKLKEDIEKEFKTEMRELGYI
tara:strand:- start:12 stop:866 length:855 start_codon:yes stop_codon:yes gene_type:complete